MIGGRRWRTRLLTHEPDRWPAVEPRERELWALVAEAEAVRAAAPAAPSRAELLAARDAALHALVLQERLARQVALVEEALRRPRSWLRPIHRARLVGQLRDRTAVADTARDRLHRAQTRFADLRQRAAHRRDYFAAHADVLAAARSARAELDQRIDDIIDGYARMADPPAWFRFGLGYPPEPDAQAEWLDRARAEIGRRRRHGAGAAVPADPVFE